MSILTILEAISEGLSEAMESDPRVVSLGEDAGLAGGVFKVTEGLQESFGEERVIDSPLAESALIGVAIGMSLNGLRPVAEIQFADFIHSAFDQIMNEAAKMRYRSNNGWHSPIVIRVPYGAGVHGGLYHSQSIEALLAHIPGLKIVAGIFRVQPDCITDVARIIKNVCRFKRRNFTHTQASIEAECKCQAIACCMSPISNHSQQSLHLTVSWNLGLFHWETS